MSGTTQNPDLESQLILGRRFANENNAKAARACFANAAKAGSLEGLRLLGINLLTQTPIEGESGMGMVHAAATEGDAEAAHVCAMLAAADPKLSDKWSVVRRYLDVAAERGFVRAQEGLAFLERTHCDFTIAPRARRIVFDAPHVGVIEQFASEAECDWLMGRAQPLLHRAEVYDPERAGGRQENARSNSSVEFDIAQSDIVTMFLRARIAAASGLARLEKSSVLHYAPGQAFAPHYDFLDPAMQGCVADLKANGQRAATFLIYLNDDFEGGETDFPELGWRFKGRPGDALFFRNIDAAGQPDRRTLHAGLPPTRGEKWLFSQWLRVPPRATPPEGLRGAKRR